MALDNGTVVGNERCRNRVVTAIYHEGTANDVYHEAVTTFRMPHFNALRLIVKGVEADKGVGLVSVIASLMHKALPHRGMYRVFERALRRSLEHDGLKDWIKRTLLWTLHGSYSWNTVAVPCYRRYALYAELVTGSLSDAWVLEHGRLIIFALRERMIFIVQNDGPLRNAMDANWAHFESDTVEQTNEIRRMTATQNMPYGAILRRRSIRRPRTFDVIVNTKKKAVAFEQQSAWLRTTVPPPKLPCGVKTLQMLRRLATNVRSWQSQCYQLHLLRKAESLKAFQDQLATLPIWLRSSIAQAEWFDYWSKSIVVMQCTKHHLERQIAALRLRDDLDESVLPVAVIWVCLRCRMSKHNVPKIHKKKRRKKIRDSANFAFGHRDVLWDPENGHVLCSTCTKQCNEAIPCIKANVLGVTITIKNRTYGVCEGCGVTNEFAGRMMCVHCLHKPIVVATNCDFCLIKSTRVANFTVYNDIDAHRTRASPWQRVTLCPKHCFGLKNECVYLKSRVWNWLR